MRKTTTILMLSLAMIVLSCGEKESTKKQLVVKNNMASSRSMETVSIALDSLDLKNIQGNFSITDTTTGIELVTQEVDTNGDGKMDVILFQPEIGANSEKIFEITSSKAKIETASVPACYSRFVPERTDDYAWENNRVAFRTYGP
ncbi:DUF4861 domain-containing protein, partial [Maribacter sp.]|nr:DUF4861 domain-containing protein [Maribacter sp.]